MTAVDVSREGGSLTNVEAAEVLGSWPIYRVLAEVLSTDGKGLRFQFENGRVMDWWPDDGKFLLADTDYRWR